MRRSRRSTDRHAVERPSVAVALRAPAVAGFLLGACMAAILAVPGRAPAQEPDEDAWSGRMDAHVWLANVDGEQSMRSEIDSLRAVGDSALHGGLAVRFEAWRRSLGGVLEISRAAVPGQATASDGDVAPAADLRISTVDMGAGFRVGRPPPSSAVEFLAGARYVRHTRALAPSADFVSRGQTGGDWVDPFAGGRFRSALGGGFLFTMAARIGGWGLGSDFFWEMDGEVGFRPARPVELVVRYRFLETEYDGGPGEYRWDGQTQGWLLGVGLYP